MPCYPVEIAEPETIRMKILLHGKEAATIKDVIAARSEFELVETDPDTIVCFGGDGTLLTAEQRWPGVPKVPILNSSRGNRCIARPPAEVLDRLAANELRRTEFTKLECKIKHDSAAQENQTVEEIPGKAA